jgi:hypothetical protein
MGCAFAIVVPLKKEVHAAAIAAFNLSPGTISGFDDGEMDLCDLHIQYGIVGF